MVIYDRSIHSLADEHKRLMQAAFNSFNAQFIANEKGYIIKANDSFLAMTSLTPARLQQMTLMDWLEKQVIFNESNSGFLKTLLVNKFWRGEV